MPRAPKVLVWLSDEVTVPPFSVEAGAEAGALLWRLRHGEALGLPMSRPMPSIGPRCHESRVRDRDHSWRIVYHVARDAIVVLDIFPKTTRETPRPVRDLCRTRLARYRRDSGGADG